MRYGVHILLKCDFGGRPDAMVGHQVYKTNSIQKAKDYADQNHMLTGQTYDVWENNDCYNIVHTGEHNPKFLVK
jgi:hypothetical protein